MLAVTTDGFPGVKIIPLGIVTGSHVEAISFIKDAFIKFKDTIGGSSGTFSNAIDACTRKAFGKMIEDANNLKADAVVGVRLHVNILQTDKGKMAQVTVYGTAVRFSDNLKKLKKIPKRDFKVGDDIDLIIDTILGDND